MKLVRYRTSLVQTRAQEANRLQKVLEGANIQLSSVISDVLGVSGQRILAALVAGESDPQVLARLADRRSRASADTLTAAPHGLVQAHQRLLLKVQLGHLTFLDQQIATLSDEITARLANFDEVLTRLATIPGVGRRTAEDMERFPSAPQLVSWAGFSPWQQESAGHAQSPDPQGQQGLADGSRGGRAGRGQDADLPRRGVPPSRWPPR